MAFVAGDSVHVRAIGKGIVREVRNGGRLLVEVHGRAFVTTIDAVTHAQVEKKKKSKAPPRVGGATPQIAAIVSLDLHGMTVEESHEAVIAFLDRALRTGATEAHIIHGRSGGRLKSALHAQLKKIPAVQRFAIDPRNPGVTIVKL